MTQQARTVQNGMGARAHFQAIGGAEGAFIAIEIPANAFTVNIYFTNGNQLVKADCS